MRSSDQELLEKTLKTGALAVAAAVGAAAITGNNQTGLMVAASGVTLLIAHQLGAKRRPGSNAIASASSTIQGRLFDNKDAAAAIQAKNAARNIINGGAAIVDGIIETTTDCAAAITKKK